MKEATETIPEISSLVQWYYENAKKDIAIETLLSAQDRLAGLSYSLAYYAGECKDHYNQSYFIRKIEHSRKKQAIMNGGKSATAADTEATIENEANYKDELSKEAESYQADLLLKQVNKILSAMQQRISFLKLKFDKLNCANSSN